MDLITVATGASGSVISIRKHRIPSDYSPSDGGNDAGPAPAELWVASLGACVALAVATYCRAHGYGEGVEVNLTYTMAKDPVRIASVVIDVQVPASVPDDRVEAIRRVVERCPIHATLTQPPEIDVEIVR